MTLRARILRLLETCSDLDADELVRLLGDDVTAWEIQRELHAMHRALLVELSPTEDT